MLACIIATTERYDSRHDEYGSAAIPPQTLLEKDFLERIRRELVRLCDLMERHGLVDYQMGVWEEEIISSECSISNFGCEISDERCDSPDQMPGHA